MCFTASLPRPEFKGVHEGPGIFFNIYEIENNYVVCFEMNNEHVIQFNCINCKLYA